MDQERIRQVRVRLFIEKSGVEFLTLAAMVAVFAVAGPLVRRMDPLSAWAFLPAGEWGRLLTTVQLLWALAAVCGAVMVFARPEGVLTTVLVGLAGMSVASPPMRTLLWRHQDHLSRFYLILVGELALLGVAMVVAASIVVMVGRLTRPLAGRWAWRSPLAIAGIEESDAIDDAARIRELPLYKLSPALAAVVWGVLSLTGRAPAGGAATAGANDPSGIKRRAACGGVTLVVAVGLLIVLMQTSERYQVLFAVGASFFLASLLAHQIFPTACGPVMWAMPLAVGAAVYALAAYTAGGSGATSMAWLEAPRLARALPIDWIGAGSGGAVAGHWLSTRMHETKTLEHHMQSL